MPRFKGQKRDDNNITPAESRHDLQVFPITADGPSFTPAPQSSGRFSDESIRDRPGRRLKGSGSKQDVPRDNGPVNGGPILQEGTSPAGDMPWPSSETSAVHGGWHERRAKRWGVR